jgi:Domain of unknown function (DUF4326)
MPTTCNRCNRKLKNPIYVKIGMGKVCLTKVRGDSERQESLFDLQPLAQSKDFTLSKEAAFHPVSGAPSKHKVTFTPIIPIRLQRSRKKGFHLTSPNGLPNKYIGRGTKWGNNYREGDTNEEGTRPLTRKQAVKMFRVYQLPMYTKQELEELRGKNLVCFCELTDICHGDILLRAANKRKPKQ